MLFENHTGLLSIDRRLRKGFTWLNPNGVSLKSLGWFVAGALAIQVPAAILTIPLMLVDRAGIAYLLGLIAGVIGGAVTLVMTVRKGREKRTPSRRIVAAVRYKFSTKQNASLFSYRPSKHRVSVQACSR